MTPQTKYNKRLEIINTKLPATNWTRTNTVGSAQRGANRSFLHKYKAEFMAKLIISEYISNSTGSSIYVLFTTYQQLCKQEALTGKLELYKTYLGFLKI
jgi:hypothetical protein